MRTLRMITIGLTGGIGSGKTNVGKVLSELGARYLDADKIGHSVYEPNTPAFEKIVTTFGNSIVDADGKINRRLLGAKVFGDKNEMKKLTDIVWPAISAKAKQEIDQWKNEGKTEIAVLEAAVLIEANWQDIVDQIWVTAVPPEEAKRRIMVRNNMSEEDAQKRIAAQLTNEDRIKYANVVIDTTGTFEETRAKVESHFRKLKEGRPHSTL